MEMQWRKQRIPRSRSAPALAGTGPEPLEGAALGATAELKGSRGHRAAVEEEGPGDTTEDERPMKTAAEPTPVVPRCQTGRERQMRLAANEKMRLWATDCAQAQAPPAPPGVFVFWDEPTSARVPSGAAAAIALGSVGRATARTVAGAALDAASSPFSSLGSVGHPHGCGRACKFAGKATGCKAGHLCDRCHLCQWTRAEERSYTASVA